VSLLGSALVFNHLNDSQSRCQQNLPSFTTNWQFAQNQNLSSYIFFTLHYSDWICKMLLTYMFCLPVPNTQCTNQLHGHSTNYLELTYQQYYQRDFSQGVMVAQRRIWNYFTNLLTACA
jgi:hypothetical protein